MWILDSEGDFLDGKRVWLRPGKKYLFGRIKQDGVRHAIQHNSISRKHMVIEVASVKPGDEARPYAKSKIFVSDQGSKVGTQVDGEQIESGSKKLLAGEEHTIKLGRYKHDLRIKWQPVILTFSLSSKELKAKDPLARVRSRVEDLDIKTIVEYVGKTTHVVSKKRNTSKGLQGLVNGKYIVQDSYIDALVYAATPSDLEALESLSPLESDFDSAWPDPMEHVPPPGNEPVQRPAEAFVPNASRMNIFDGYTFIFGDPSQYDNLQAPINEGHGKALLYPIENGVTTPAEIVQYMRNAAGQKGLGEERDGPGGVVLVRFRASGDYEKWSNDLDKQVAQMTDQRVIEQKEFLDAILGNDATPLCRQLLSSPESSPDTRMEPQSQAAMVPDNSQSQSPLTSQPPEEPSQAPKSKAKASRVRPFVSKMKTFDDGFDIASIPAYEPEADIPSPPPMDMEVIPEEPSQAQPNMEEEEEDVMSSLLPGAKALKRRRAETVHLDQDDSKSHVKQEVERKPKRQKLDVIQAARQHREAEDDARRKQEEASFQDSLKDTDIEKLKDLAIVEEMEVPSRLARAQSTDKGDRWDERWNGRKNFKKFRAKGDSSQPRHRVQTVIVPLEEVTRKEFGIGDHHWVSTRKSPENSPPPASRSVRSTFVSQENASSSPPQSTAPVESQTPAPVSQARSQKRAREVRDSESDDDELRFRFRRRR
ncbi:hypothetical protein ASPWEDRAFT_60863 [Aspergillus wentii DTO 134E9]|uniref:FHA domain-containing protein n=1 Tax=Aspergillus wentii DTO 134E9 TaxID=1073089 RepID=A0A1L9RI12_ASPWE|nr:uncharacterized protein ASPWEDRAFT_60863 [Aspergillus wentii DTO 134E9]OJJ34498.1 hypothetical protein ASPWEDRAFT_60863 [Aspergillus wentii DTO 134E9]